MELYKTTHQTDWRRVRWVHDEDYNPVGSYAFADDKETQEAVNVELAGLDNGSLVVLGAIVETKCQHCKQWDHRDSLWGIVVDANEDLEAWGTENLDIPKKPPFDPDSPEGGCSEKPWRSPTLDELESVAPKKGMKWVVVERAEGWRVRDNNGDLVGESQGTLSKAIALMHKLRDDFVRPKPKRKLLKPVTLDSIISMVPDNKPRKKLPKKVRDCIEAALRRADSKLRKGCGVSKEAQEAMRLYLDTWVAGPLRTILDWDDGNDEPFPNWS